MEVLSFKAAEKGLESALRLLGTDVQGMELKQIQVRFFADRLL